jgi:hypothetical protein
MTYRSFPSGEVNIKEILFGPIGRQGSYCPLAIAAVLLRPTTNVESHLQKIRRERSAKDFKIIYVIRKRQYSVIRNRT